MEATLQLRALKASPLSIVMALILQPPGTALGTLNLATIRRTMHTTIRIVPTSRVTGRTTRPSRFTLAAAGDLRAYLQPDLPAPPGLPLFPKKDVLT